MLCSQLLEFAVRIGAVSQMTTAAHGYYKQDMATKVPNSVVAVQLVC